MLETWCVYHPDAGPFIGGNDENEMAAIRRFISEHFVEEDRRTMSNLECWQEARADGWAVAKFVQEIIS